MTMNPTPWYCDHLQLRNLIAFLDASGQIGIDDAVVDIVDILGTPWSWRTEALSAEIWTLLGADRDDADTLCELQSSIESNRERFEAAIAAGDMGTITVMIDELRAARELAEAS